MGNIFLTYEEDSKENFRRIIAETAEAVTDAFTDGRAYAGPTPDELKKIIKVDNILPENGQKVNRIPRATLLSLKAY